MPFWQDRQNVISKKINFVFCFPNKESYFYLFKDTTFSNVSESTEVSGLRRWYLYAYVFTREWGYLSHPVTI